MISIYKITHKETGKCYIGQAQDVERRWKLHCSQSSGCKKLSRAIQKYGVDAFTFKVLFECDPEHADALETQCICWYGSVKNGYNICPQGGSRRGSKCSEETKKKISDAMKGKRTGKKNPMYGKTRSEETRRKIGTANKGKYTGENHPKSKLTNIQREEIKSLYATGEYSTRQLGKHYSISHTQISRILRK